MRPGDGSPVARRQLTCQPSTQQQKLPYDRSLEPDAEIVVYCSGPGCPQSVAAAQKLAELGFRDVRAYEGGLAHWKEAGLPVDEVAVGAETG